METILQWLLSYEYLAMFVILLLCGLGLPLPEEVTLLSSGLLVGWGHGNFFFACVACTLGILAGDAMIFLLGRRYGTQALRGPGLRLFITAKRVKQIRAFFAKHGAKALFWCRFFPGVRIGVYAIAGAHHTPWWRFLLLDGLGCLISVPSSIWMGRWAAQVFADDKEAAMAMALQKAHHFGRWFFVLIGSLLLLRLGWYAWQRRREQPPDAQLVQELTDASSSLSPRSALPAAAGHAKDEPTAPL